MKKEVVFEKVHKDGSVEIIRQNQELMDFVDSGVLFNGEVAEALKIPRTVAREENKVYCRLIDTLGHSSWGISTAKQTKNGDWILEGVCSIFAVEYGRFMLSELLEVNQEFGMNRIQIDVSYSKPLSINEYKAYVYRELETLGVAVIK